MAAALTLPQVSSASNSTSVTERIAPRQGVITLYGYGINVHVDRGHLVLKDGVCQKRRMTRLPRVGHGLRRLVVIGTDGTVTLSALEWLAAQRAAFVMLDRDGSVRVATGPRGPSDARLRRAQALAHHTGAAIPIMHRLIDQELTGQSRLIREFLNDEAIDAQIQDAKNALVSAKTPEDVRYIESRAALAYWSAWHNVPVLFQRAELHRTPDHWRTFGARRSPLSASPRLAVNPVNAILNICTRFSNLKRALPSPLWDSIQVWAFSMLIRTLATAWRAT